ncbi:uncharacterized protein ACRADG_005456 isoform 2-T3 [Cochliomyia hominivorax]
MEHKPKKRIWRKLVKKLQRKRKRQKFAQQRDKELQEEKLKDPLYKSWLEQQEAQHQLAEENERRHQEELWLRRELLAQQQFKRDEQKRLAEEAKLEAERFKQEEELKRLEEVRQKRREEIKLQAEAAAKEFEDVLTCMQTYLDDSTMKTPSRLESFVQSRPGEKSCDFFDKTNCCRFGIACSFNHKRPLLAKIIMIKHFFQHPLLEQEEHEEYARSDSKLELNERDLRDSYDEFCEDVWPVLEEFGSIVNFRTVRNIQAHLRGHVFVEYEEKRSALKAFIKLQNRYYASKRLNVEFSNIRQWRTGICGLALGRKCPKGVKCNFFHLMCNKDNKYNEPIVNPERSIRSGTRSDRKPGGTPLNSWNSEDSIKDKNCNSHNWRWSESPEIELKSTSTVEHTKHSPPRSLHNKNNHRKSRSKSPKTSHHKSYRKSKSKSPISRSHKKSRNSLSSPHPKKEKSHTKEDAKKIRKHKKRDKSPSSIHRKRGRSKSPNETFKAKIRKR